MGLKDCAYKRQGLWYVSLKCTQRWFSPTSKRVGMQVFFIRDGIQFVDLVHCLRPNPKTHIQEGWRILDFLSHHPESVHIVRPAA